MKSITNQLKAYIDAPSNIYKSVTKGAVILTHVVCLLLCIIVAIAETHPVAAIFVLALMGAIVFLTKNSPKKNNQ